jgi:hypothetical protein
MIAKPAYPYIKQAANCGHHSTTFGQGTVKVMMAAPIVIEQGAVAE